MKLTIPKNRNVPLLIIAATGTMIALILGMYLMNRMVQNTYETTIKQFDTLSEKTTEILKDGMEDNCKSLQVTALLLGQLPNISKDNMSDILPFLAQNNGYLDLAIVNSFGKGFDEEGFEVDFGGEAFFEEASNGKIIISSLKTWKGYQEPVFVYAVPIFHGKELLGVLAAIRDAKLDQIKSLNLDPIHKERTIVYVVNENKEIISLSNAKEQDKFDYSEITLSGNSNQATLHPRSVFNFMDYISFRNTNKDMTVWFEKPLGVNNWSVLVGRTYILEPVLMSIIQIANILLVVILSCIILLFFGLVIQQRRSNKKLIQMVYLDPVTGGTNWYKFRNDVNKILNSRLFHKKKYALINFDINRFKLINDSFGHQKGDEILRDIYTIVRKWAKPGEPYTRYSADQFYILLSYHDEVEVSDRIIELNHNLHQLKFVKAGKFYFGVYYITERKDSIDRMGDFAGIAKHSIKGNNEGIIAYFDDLSRKRLLEEEHIERSMYDALKKESFLVYLQPKYAVQKERIIGAEALVRWISDAGNLISPGFFIPLFEKNGFIIELDMYMLRKVCEIQKGWLDKGYKPLPVSVNISRLHFANPHLADIIRNTVDEYQVPHELIELELTESAFLQNKQMLINTVILLRKYGFLVSMDDFGAGYSSLNSLKDIPLDIVKLDGELFRITEEVERGQTVIRNTISMAKDLHMQVVAECIETREQVEFLCAVGCDIIQGFYYAKPMPIDQFESVYIRGLQSYRI